MAKKKKKTGRADARGYSTTSTTGSNNNNKSNAAAASSTRGSSNAARKVAVSATAHDNLTSLLTDLKGKESASLPSSNVGSNRTRGKQRSSYLTDRPGHTAREYPVDPTDRKFIKKVSSIHNALIDLSFSEDQIESALRALGAANGSDFDLDLTLDWLCLNLSDLPSLFIEQDVQIRALEEGGISVHVVKGGNRTNDMSGSSMGVSGADVGRNYKEFESASDLMVAATSFSAAKGKEMGSLPKHKKVEKVDDNDEESKARRALILEQYQYEEESEADEVEDNVHDQNVAESEAGVRKGDQVQEEIGLTPEEQRLAELERQIEEYTATLNDDAAMYMMSKYEVADLRKSLKKVQGQARGLKGKVARIRAAREKRKPEESSALCEEVDEEDEEATAAFSLFGDGGDDEDGNADDTFASTDTKKNDEPLPLHHLGRKYSTISTNAPSIPKGWTGTTPKKVLEDYCKKQKWPRPQFSALSQTSSGCKLVVNIQSLAQKTKNKASNGATQSKEESLIIENPGPFFSFGDSQQYLATEALYELSPSLPLYRLLPPVFRGIWTAWQKEEEEEKIAEVAEEESKKRANIDGIIMSIYEAYEESRTDTPNKSDPRLTSTNSVGEEEEDKVPDDWEDGSLEGDISNKNRAAVGNTASVSVHHDAMPTSLGKKLCKEFEEKTSGSVYEAMLEERKSLPIYAYRKSLLDTVRANTVTVLHAQTGAGKSTNCPLFLLEEALETGRGDKVNIICTQPRRVAAISVAERVADEMCEGIGSSYVGYHIRGESKKSSKTRLLFCTTGVILRRLQDDPSLRGVTHVVVDEVHERQWQIDFLLIALRRLINTTRKDLKVVLMSATIDSRVFCTFFQGAPFVSVPGRTFPVADYYLEDLMDATNHIIEQGSRCAIRNYRGKSDTAELWVTGRGGEKHRKVVSLEDEVHTEITDEFESYKMSTRRSMERVDERVLNYDLIEECLALLLLDRNNDSIVLPDGADNESLSKGSVLVFLPGIGEIRSLSERLKGSRQFGAGNRFDIIPMHSSLSPKEQRKAFIKPKAGCQKIILATNICETSITIPDIVCVIDSGLMREVRQDKRSGTSTLVTDWCSRANAKQRSGRAGRVQPGLCCKLFSSRTLHKEMREQPMPELQRVPLEEACLAILAGNLGLSCLDFLLQAPQPPSRESVQAALVLLEEVGAIESSAIDSPVTTERLTPLGVHLAKLPVHVRLGKMLIFGALFKCLDETLTIAASLSTKSPFAANVTSPAEAAAAHRTFAHSSSDFRSICNVWNAYQSATSEGYSKGRKFCDRNYLNHTALVEIADMRDQFIELLGQIGFVSLPARSGGKSGYDLKEYNSHSNVDAVVDAVIVAGLYPNVAHAEKVTRTDPPQLWCNKERVYFHSSSVNHKVVNLESDWVAFYEKFATSRTYIAATSLAKPYSLLLFGKSIVVRHLERMVVVDDSVQLKMAAQTGVAFRELRYEIESILKEMIETRTTGSANQERMIHGIVELLASEAS